jgi:hypothetical protein
MMYGTIARVRIKPGMEEQLLVLGAGEDEYIKANYPNGDKMTILEALPSRSWNMIYQRALTLGVHRRVNTLNTIPQNVTVEDLNVIPDREMALKLVVAFLNA